MKLQPHSTWSPIDEKERHAQYGVPIPGHVYISVSDRVSCASGDDDYERVGLPSRQ